MEKYEVSNTKKEQIENFSYDDFIEKNKNTTDYKIMLDVGYCYSNENNPADFTRIGNILIKKDTSLALDYYHNLMENKKLYNKHKRAFDLAYNDALKKHQDGYKYISRKRK